MDIKNVLVVGGGTMGRDIAIVIAEAGVNVKIADISPEATGKAIIMIGQRLDKRIEKKELDSAKKPDILALIKPGALRDASDADLVIEAVFEDLKVKGDIFKQLGALCPKNTILATNTSALSITKIAEEVPSPERVIGLHFFNFILRPEKMAVCKVMFFHYHAMKNKVINCNYNKNCKCWH